MSTPAAEVINHQDHDRAWICRPAGNGLCQVLLCGYCGCDHPASMLHKITRGEIGLCECHTPPVEVRI